jgi:hypothetical protein
MVMIRHITTKDLKIFSGLFGLQNDPFATILLA